MGHDDQKHDRRPGTDIPPTAPPYRTQVRQVRDAIQREFTGLIDLDDLANRPSHAQTQEFLSRALAALVVRDLTKYDSATAATAVIDGRDDIGIDAVAVDEDASRLWLIQSKWSDKGRAGFGVDEALKFGEGLKDIDARRFDRFNARFQRLAEQVNTVLASPHARITMVCALMRTDPLHDDVVRRLTDIEEEFNRLGSMVDHDVYLARDIWRVVRDDNAEPPIPLVVKMDDWIQITAPYEAFHGVVAVDEVAGWYDAHGDRLFARNIRQPLGLTQVNHGLIETLTDKPENFWYFNNGITILCDSLESIPFRRGAARTPMELHLAGATVVNGAQTVHAIYEASRRRTDAEAGGDGYVGVRVISLTNCPTDFAAHVTVATNTQNRVDARDFVALDEVQAAIKEDFTLSLQLTYTLKRGEPEPPPETGCSVVTAATALACAHPNPDLAVRARRNTDLLWERGPQGAYELLFSRDDRPSAYQIWRSVRILRSVDDALHELSGKLQARAEAIAERGNRLIAHIVFQSLDLNDIDDPDADWDDVLRRVPELVENATHWLVHHLDTEYGTGSIIASTLARSDRSRQLARLVLASLRSGQPSPELAPDYRPPKRKSGKQRRPNAVPTVVDAGRLADGTRLVYLPSGQPEREATADWLAEDPKRGTATWVNQRVRPLLWAFDGERYSPSGLVQRIWKEAGWAKAPVAAQGPSRWYVAGEGSLWDIAQEVLASTEAEEENSDPA